VISETADSGAVLGVEAMEKEIERTPSPVRIPVIVGVGGSRASLLAPPPPQAETIAIVSHSDSALTASMRKFLCSSKVRNPTKILLYAVSTHTHYEATLKQT
jgi:hypothetical protein